MGQSYGDLKAAYDEKLRYAELLNEKITQLRKQRELDGHASAERLANVLMALQEANNQTGLVQDSLSLVQDSLSLVQAEFARCRTESRALAADLKTYKPRTWAGRKLRKVRNGLAVVGTVAILAVTSILILN